MIQTLPGWLDCLPFLHLHQPDPNPFARPYNTELAFSVLGTNASGAIPALTRLLNEPARGHDGFRAALALEQIGPAGYQVLLQTAANSRAKGKPWADLALHNIDPEILTNALTFPDSSVRSAASNALRQITAEVLTNTP